MQDASQTPPYAALVLAGRRSADDPLAAAAGATHRALLEIAGEPMLERVVARLEARAEVASLAISTDAPELIAASPGLAPRIERDALQLVRAAPTSPAQSVLQAIAAWPPTQPVLVTTADHALLDDRMLDHLFARAAASEADLCVGLVGERTIQARFPDAKRTYLPFRDERCSGANLFVLRTQRARAAVRFWQDTERHRKQPWRLALRFGVANLLRFATRRLSLDDAMAEASRVIGARCEAVLLPFAEAAVDVDKLEDLELVRAIVAERGAQPS